MDRYGIVDTREENIIKAATIIRGGGVVAFPTETVYGLGGNAMDPSAATLIYEVKGRPSDNPLIVHISDLRCLEKIVKNIPDMAVKLAEEFWPGPLTMVFEADEVVPKQTTGGLKTVAVRMPDNEAALRLISASGGYVAAPSANSSGRPSPTRASHVMEDLGQRIPMILDGGDSVLGLESTIVDVTGSLPMILRPGFITEEDLKRVLGVEIMTDPAVESLDKAIRPKAPGMKYKHYAPKGKMVMLEGDVAGISERLKDFCIRDMSNGEKIGIFCTQELMDIFFEDKRFRVGHTNLNNFKPREIKKGGLTVVTPSKTDDVNVAAAGFYAALRDFDRLGITSIYAQSFGDEGTAKALKNRMIRSAGGMVVKA